MDREFLGMGNDAAMPGKAGLASAPVYVGVALIKAKMALKNVAEYSQKVRKRHLCRGWESNPHAPSGARDFESRASAYSATSARQRLYPETLPGLALRAYPIPLDHHFAQDKTLFPGGFLYHRARHPYGKFPHLSADSADEMPVILGAERPFVVSVSFTKLYFSYGPIFFVFQAKCFPVAKEAGVKLWDLVLVGPGVEGLEKDYGERV